MKIRTKRLPPASELCTVETYRVVWDHNGRSTRTSQTRNINQALKIYKRLDASGSEPTLLIYFTQNLSPRGKKNGHDVTEPTT